VLGYLTQTKSAARVRMVTAAGSLLFGLAPLGLGLLAFYSSAIQIYSEAEGYASVHGGPMTWRDVMEGLKYMQAWWSSGVDSSMFVFFRVTLFVRLVGILRRSRGGTL
jgi:hypothetical protein